MNRAGYSEKRINNWNLNYVVLGGGPSFTVQEPALTTHGYTVGAGAEYRLANNVSLRGEYRYVALGRNTTVDPLGAVWTTDLSEHVVGSARPIASASSADLRPLQWRRC